MAGNPDPDQASGYFAPVSGAKYIQLTTFRRNGTAVPTPVHIVADGDTAFFRTWNVAGKAKRLRHTPAVQIAPSTVRGRPLGAPIRAEAHLLEGEASEHAARLLAAKLDVRGLNGSPREAVDEAQALDCSLRLARKADYQGFLHHDGQAP